MKLKTVTTAAGVAGTMALLAACSGATTGASAGAGKAAGVADLRLTPTTPQAAGPVAAVNWLLEDEPDSLDLDTQGGSAGRTVLTNVCERLYQLQPDMSVQPFLALQVARPDATHLVLTLRDDVTFHDGSKMTADDVLFSLKRHAAPEMEQSDEFGNVSAMRKTGENEVTITFKQPDALFTKALAGDAGLVYNREQVEKAGKEFGTPGQGDACSGPYELSGWKSGDSITLTRADSYWGEKPLTGKVVFRWADDSAMVNALATGAADGTYADNIGTAAALRGKKGLDEYFGPSTSTLALIPTERGGLADPDIRKALSLVLDRSGIAKSGYGGLIEPWATPVGSGAWGYAKDAFAAAQKKLTGAPAGPGPQDLARAKELVNTAKNAPTEPIVIGTDSSQGRMVIANAVRAALTQIGLKGQIKTVPAAQYGEFYGDKEARADIDVLVADWYISKSDPLGFYDNGLSDSSNNWVGFKSAAYDAKVEEGLRTLDDAKRADIAIEVQRRFADAAVWIPVAQVPTALVIDDKLTGPPASMAYLYHPWAAQLGAKKG
ncbi:peptide/nickel transport system substrate-binding protein [Streptomyces sp. cf386]|uniref:ABC transporter substrate-binding protein n=1 Tax=Streptomyces sp. cf386 TaxID=1761904 RepID=UPI0008848BD7|nr:ABC transporter substrate-binding protein [Streptomyces sp. cf386]SDP42377.1 peptide/nickel transport system substrate-binding protein [Streptomyces sp. cf386]